LSDCCSVGLLAKYVSNLEDKVNTNYVSLGDVNFVIAELLSTRLSAVEAGA
jgi:hypothetical protein